jgi:predicted GH43/DUF377 family glycosyl hydrolase
MFLTKVTDFDMMIWRNYREIIHFNPSHQQKENGCRAYFRIVTGNFTQKSYTPRYEFISFTNKRKYAYT